MTEELINALEKRDINYIDNNFELLFSNKEFFEKLYLHIIRNKFNKSVIHLIKNYQVHIPISTLEVGYYESITKYNNDVFDCYYQLNIVEPNTDRNLPFILACDYSNKHIAKILFNDLKVNPMDNRGKAFIEACKRDDWTILSLFFKNKKISEAASKDYPVAYKEAQRVMLQHKVDLF